MTDPTLPTLAFIGLVFGGVAAARLLLRAAMIVNGVIRELTKTGRDAQFRPPFVISRAA